MVLQFFNLVQASSLFNSGGYELGIRPSHLEDVGKPIQDHLNSLGGADRSRYITMATPTLYTTYCGVFAVQKVAHSRKGPLSDEVADLGDNKRE